VKKIIVCSVALFMLMSPAVIIAEQKQKTEFCKCDPCKCDPCLCGKNCECGKSDKECQNSCQCLYGKECICSADDQKCSIKNLNNS
jgi:hypothetical protein